MKLFDFLKLLSLEKFSFNIDYVEWSNEVKITVDTFVGIEIYTFDHKGITNHTAFEKQVSTGKRKAILQKLEALTDRSLKAWVEAAKDLNVTFIYPYTFIGIDNIEYQATGLLPEFGHGKGVLITSRKDNDDVFKMADLTNDYFLSALNPYHYDQYNREQIIETLSDWGWIGEGSPPDWLIPFEK